MNSRELTLKAFAKTNGRCFYCNEIGQELDHFVSRHMWDEWDLDKTPLKGKLNDIENLFPVCRSCNRKKSGKAPEDFIGNPYEAWSRYFRANKRIGLIMPNRMTVWGFK